MGAGNGDSGGQMTPRNLPEVKDGVLTSRFFGKKYFQLILSKIIKIVATSCQILRLKCTKFDFGWGSARDQAGALTFMVSTGKELRQSSVIDIMNSPVAGHRLTGE